jgi:malonate transporter
MISVLGAIIPIFMLLALGWAFRQRKFPGDALWDLLDPLVYYVLFPSLLLHNFATVDLGELSVLPAGASVVCAMLLATGLVLLIRKWLPVPGPGLASMIQTTLRFNAYLGFAAATQLYGSAGLTLFSVVVAFVTPTANIISITAFTRFSSQAGAGPKQLLLTLATNPLIASVLLGVALNVTGIGLPWVLESFFDILGQAALPLGLLAAGAGLEIEALRRGGRVLLVGCILRLIVMPALALLTTWIFDVEGLTRMAVLIYAVMPSPPGAYIVARQMGGDGRLTAAIIAASTLLSLITVPVLLSVLG